MADLAQVLMLPPPVPQRLTLPARDTAELAVNAEASTGGESARARRFRFRVYEGGDAGEANTRTDTVRPETGRTTASRLSLVSDTGGNGEIQADGTRQRTSGSYGAARFQSHASAPFLAQSIAQEQLGEGLHNPPNQQATIAYTRAATALQPRLTAGIDLSA